MCNTKDAKRSVTGATRHKDFPDAPTEHEPTDAGLLAARTDGSIVAIVATPKAPVEMTAAVTWM